MWKQKQTKDLTLTALELRELFEAAKELKQELREIKQLADDVLLKAQISHCLIVVRKIGEDKLEVLSKLLD